MQVLGLTDQQLMAVLPESNNLADGLGISFLAAQRSSAWHLLYGNVWPPVDHIRESRPCYTSRPTGSLAVVPVSDTLTRQGHPSLTAVRSAT